VIVEGRLPERSAGAPAKSEGTFVFEGPHKPQEISAGRHPLQQKVEMVGHNTVGAKLEGMMRYFEYKQTHQPLGSLIGAKIYGAPKGAQCQKVPAIAYVVLCVEPNIFVAGKERHRLPI
jgi:hypothetical protein